MLALSLVIAAVVEARWRPPRPAACVVRLLLRLGARGADVLLRDGQGDSVAVSAAGARDVDRTGRRLVTVDLLWTFVGASLPYQIATGCA
jgi:hypothetical protein